MTTRLRELRRSTGAALCLACGKCTTMCPLAGSDGFAAHRVATHDLEDELAGHQHVIGRCLTCAACEVRCPQGVGFADYVRGLRASLPEGARPPRPHDAVFDAAARLDAADGTGATGAPVTEAATARRPRTWLDDDLAVAEEGEVGLFVGCAPLFDAYFRKSLEVRTTDIARSAVRLLNALGVTPVVADDERCCGHDLLWGGDPEAFAALARANVRAFAARGVKKVVTACAECYRTWARDFPAAVGGALPQVAHLSELLAEGVAAGRLTFQDDGVARRTYQDPCRLGRQMGVYDAPRAVLRALGGTFREMARSGADAACCGTPGFVHCDAASRRIQDERLREAAATGADTLVTTCPKCWIHFACAQSDRRDRTGEAPAIAIADLSVVAAAALAGNAPSGSRGDTP